MNKQDMLDYLKSLKIYENETLFYEEKMIDSNKTIPIKDLVERFIEIDKEYEEVTNKLSEDDKTELIDDLIYAMRDLIKNASKEKTEDIDLEKPQHFTKEQALWIKNYCSIKNKKFYNQAINDFADKLKETIEYDSISDANYINYIAGVLKETDNNEKIDEPENKEEDYDR